MINGISLAMVADLRHFAHAVCGNTAVQFAVDNRDRDLMRCGLDFNIGKLVSTGDGGRFPQICG